MPPVPILRPREVVRAFRKLGWEADRQHGSHIILTKPGHIATLSVPNHTQVPEGHCEP
jgi:predicted RNA binding protein YcfA (HicA-like mRNA interferase family)